ncbi:MAG: CHASE2 domain-containing protein [Kiritimatiellae bacterium]|nr:CHASE2 domain-containing protein [Kiritimatiellia bacterium]
MRLVRHPAFNLILGIVISIVAYTLFGWVPLFEQIELNTLDVRYRRRPPIETDPTLGTIDIDMATIDLAGSWPVPRNMYAELMRVLEDYDARLMAVDIFFPDPSPLTVSPEQVAEARRLVGGEGMPHALESLLADMARGDDEAMAEAMRDTQMTVLSQTFSVASPQEYPDTISIDLKTRTLAETAMRAAHVDALALAEAFSLPYDAPDGRNDTVARGFFVEPPDPRFLEHAVGLGFAQILYDVDGTVRRYPLFLQYDGRLYPSVGMMVVSLVTGVPLSAMEIVPGSHVLIPSSRRPGMAGASGKGDIRIPVDRMLSMDTNWAGDYLGTFTHFPAALLLEFRADDLVRARIRAYGSDTAALLTEGMEAITGEVVRRRLLKQVRAEGMVRDLLLARLVELARQEDPLGKSDFLDAFVSEDDAETRNALGSIWDQVADNERMLELLRTDADMDTAELVEAVGRSPVHGTVRHYAAERLRFALKRGDDPDESCRPLYFFPPVELTTGPGEEVRRLSPLDLRDKVLFVGLTATGTHDFNPMPFSARYPMVGLHVNAANTILTGQFIRSPPAWVSFLIVLLCAVVMAIAGLRLHPLLAVGMAIVLMGGYVGAGQLFFNHRALWLPMAAPMVALVAAYLAIVVHNFLAERHEKAKVRHAFSKYVSASVVKQVLEDPDMLQLGGERRTMTVFFSDLKGFTTISETVPPEDMVGLLNEYLDHMSRIIFRYDGTLDKYEGDGIVAFWNAPVEQEDHAYLSCCAALDSVRDLDTVLRPKWLAEGKPDLTVRIGLNTGQMVVGNMGSMDRMEYSVMGDAVNLGARLEPANKAFGTAIMMSDGTRELVAGRIVDRELGTIRVKGRQQRVRAYEVVGRTGETTPGQERLMEVYRDGLEHYRARRWEDAIDAFRAALALDSEDGPSKAYLKRCKEFLSVPPDSDWDGGFVMEDV